MKIHEIDFSRLYSIRIDATSWFPKNVEGRKSLPPAPKRFSAAKSFGRLVSVDLKPNGSQACMSMLVPTGEGDRIDFKGHRIYIPLDQVVPIGTETERRLQGSPMEASTETADVVAEDADDILM